MASRKLFFYTFFILSLSHVQGASIFERSYDYVMSLGKNLAPNIMTILDCLGEDDIWMCAKDRAGKILDSWDSEVNKQRRMWQDAADAEVSSSGRSIEELPSKLGLEVEQSLTSLADLVNHGIARAFSRHHESGGGIDSITISTGDKKMKMKKKKKQKPPKIHLVHPMMMAKDEDRGFKSQAGENVNASEKKAVVVPVSRTDSDIAGKESFQNSNSETETDTVLAEKDNIQNLNLESAESEHDGVVRSETGVSDTDTDVRKGRGMFADIWSVGEKAIDAVAEHAMQHENAENEVSDKSSLEENRGKKKKKKKAILKLLILGAVLKAKIGTLLQILSFKLQVKFFLIALIGLGINLARFWIDLKKQHAPPQKVIYYEHAQHQHHYDHEHEEEHGWGPWSRSADNEETDGEIDASALPYRAQVVRNPQTYSRAAHTRI